jgi:tetratricopeptide (TPR) repeat protein
MLIIRMKNHDNWYRSANWSEEDRNIFELKLKRAKSSVNKAQYLRIKAGYMQNSDDPKKREIARILFRRVIEEFPDQITETKQSYQQLGESYQSDGYVEEAEDMYRKCIAMHYNYPEYMNWQIFSEFLLAELLSISDNEEKNREAEKILDELVERKKYFNFNSETFRYYLVRARLSAKFKREEEAFKYATYALQSFESGRTPQLPHHPTVGLVHTTDEIIKELKSLAFGNKVS